MLDFRSLIDEGQAKLSGLISGSILRASSLSLADQAIAAAFSFALVIVAARFLGPASFGLFSLLRTAMFFGATLQGSLVLSPHNVFGATKSGSEYRRYTGTAAILQIGLVLALASVFLLVLVTIEVVSDTVHTMALAMIFATVAWQFQEFTRGVLYTEQRYAASLVNNSVVTGLRAILLFVLVLGIGLTGERLFLLLGVTSCVGTVVGLVQIRNSISIAFERRVLKDHWKFGRWLTGTGVVGQLPQYVTAAVMTIVLGVSAYGAYRAFSQMMRGTQVPIRAMSSVLRPRLSRLAQDGPQPVWDTVRPIMVLGGVGLSGVAVTVFLLRESVIGLVFGPDFVPYAAVVFLILLTPIANWQKEMLSVALQAFHRTSPIFTATTIGTLAGTVAGAIALMTFGLPAAGASGLTIAFVSSIWLGRAWSHQLKGERQWDSEQIPVNERGPARRPSRS